MNAMGLMATHKGDVWQVQVAGWLALPADFANAEPICGCGHPGQTQHNQRNDDERRIGLEADHDGCPPTNPLRQGP